LLKDESEPIYQVSVSYDASTQRAKIQTSWCILWDLPWKFFEPKETRSQFLLNFCIFIIKFLLILL
jgi:hypothetical protein